MKIDNNSSCRTIANARLLYIQHRQPTMQFLLTKKCIILIYVAKIIILPTFHPINQQNANTIVLLNLQDYQYFFETKSAEAHETKSKYSSLPIVRF